MSLVHEALLKAEREKQRKTGGAPVFAQWAQPVASRPAAPTKASALSQTPVSSAPACEPSHSRGTAHVAAPAQKQHQTVLVIVAVCVALVAIVAIVFMANRTALTARKSESSGGSVSVPAVSPSAKPEPGNLKTETPIQPVPTPSPIDVSRYKITGIMKDPQGNYCAVINGRVVYVEQYIDGAIVKTVERDRVTLSENDREFVVRLN